MRVEGRFGESTDWRETPEVRGSTQMGWYDLFSLVYDPTLERLYRPVRRAAFTRLVVGGNRRVLDLACGTGQNFPPLLERLGEGSSLVGVDASAGMLRRAQRRVDRAGWSQVTLVEADARALGEVSGQEPALREAFDAVVCTLGLSALPDWERVFTSAFERLRPGGQFLLFDVWAEHRVFQSWWVERVARADLGRQVWRPLEAASIDFGMDFLAGSPHVHGGRLVVAWGFRGRVDST